VPTLKNIRRQKFCQGMEIIARRALEDECGDWFALEVNQPLLLDVWPVRMSLRDRAGLQQSFPHDGVSRQPWLPNYRAGRETALCHRLELRGHSASR
jgi:hypothetical protein